MRRPLRLLYVTTSLPYGPGEAFVLPELAELKKRGNQVWVVPIHGRGALLHEGAQDLLSRCLSGKLLNERLIFGALAEFVRAPSASLRALRSLWTPNLRHLFKNLAVLPKGLWIAREVRRLRVDHIHVHWAATTASMGMVASEVSGVPWSFTAHRWDIIENNLLTRKAQHAMFARFISESGLRLALERGFNAQDRAHVLHMGTVLPSELSSKPRERRPMRVLCPANLLPVKGHRYLLEAMALMHNERVDLWLAGQGELEGALREQATRLGLDCRMRFLGQVPHDELLRLYREGEVDVVVLPSVDLGGGLHEGIPVSLMEAMAYGLPVVSTQTGGIPELLGDGAGVLVPPADPVALAKALTRLCVDALERTEQGRSGQEAVRKRFAIERVVDKLEALWTGTSSRNEVGNRKNLA